ncbi:bifunctional isocitrate dehydrogenase kinase/phosphatase [Ferribacterium limneticum]|uniref:bifunctional isocitrate dehydrogenase kinase/phosphatase n=1 Tax=Ferribacterium limneticum TaxID=76259 RepID=UPI001CF947B9|nr:bifunctional isocitrate dehydrogenase kinase/phosphatase [Ferribacterium limneticum]UCV29537.1 bifunctional isocitrate dehydrogenase kinase/phosphatase [Ferribacterium limneticum]UCV33456.1 bifunctional isocitrate dehydrogenase kinase/phosphatase [Ferribacterium limneticum]
MKISVGLYGTNAHQIALAMIQGFNKHYTLFRQTSREAKTRFEQADWLGVHKAVKERIRFYDDRVDECVERLRNEFDAASIDDTTWQQVKLLYIGLLLNHKQPELAETFFNSVTTKILHRNYFHNDFIFVRPSISTENIEGDDTQTYRSYYAKEDGLRGAIRKIVGDFDWHRSFVDLERDIEHVYQAVHRFLNGMPRREVNFQIQVLGSAFYRNKAAYIIGKAINGATEYPFTIPVLQNEDGKLYLDTILLDAWRIGLLFSLSRAYFMVDMEVPSGYVQFLRSILPNKPRSELYIMLGLGKQGKTMFFRDFIYHLHHSEDKFIMAPGIRGLVMLVFTLPSYPYVFKLIKDVFGSSKDMDRATVKKKFMMVKQVDRVGRMADTLEFSNVMFPLKRFDDEVLAELQKLAPSCFEVDGDQLIIKHLYIERRMEPLNIHLDRMERSNNVEGLEHVIREYGSAIREMAQANVFPGDMLWKNFGVTRFGRVVFYDYDEIEYMTDINFRKIPPAPDFETEMSGEVWYPVNRGDVFPEEFATFLLTSPQVRKIFIKHHKDLLSPGFWQDAQEKIRSGHVEDFFPYPQELRFINAPAPIVEGNS